jgi:hypothetical protein
VPGDPAGAGARGEGEGGPHQVPQRRTRGHSGTTGEDHKGVGGGRRKLPSSRAGHCYVYFRYFCQYLSLS